MRKTLFATTALASMLAFGAVAQEAAAPAADDPATTMPAEPTTPEVMPESDAATDETTPMDPAVDTAQEPAAPGAAPMDPAVTDAGPVLTPVMAGEVSTESLNGATIQTMNGENIATIDDVLLTADGAVESLVATFGGFLGFGSNTVLMTMDEIEIMEDEAGNYVVQTALTPESLEGRPEYQAEN